METKEEVLGWIENIKRTKGRIDIVEVANALGIKVFETKEISQPSFIAYDSETKCYEIYINTKDVGTRQRFSIAHEIAHYLLHKDKIITFGTVGRSCEFSLSLAEEKEADMLAGSILMPERSVEDFIEQNKISKNDKFDLSMVKRVAKEFEVSLIAAALRLRELGYYVGYIEI